MKKNIFIVVFSITTTLVLAQESKYYFGISYGKSFPIGDFKDDDIINYNAGFAESGNKLDVYGGYVINKKTTLTFTFRYQNFDTDIDALTSSLEANNQSSIFTGSSDSWQTYYLLTGIAYKVSISEKFSLYPRIGFGPMLISNPEFSITGTNENTTTEVNRSSETGIGLGYEFGIGFKRAIGKSFCLMPTFTFSGGVVTISDVDTTTGNTVTTSNYKPRISTFNLGLSLAYKL
ncbi:outer membrane beta-barrel protein [Mariniflexile litorale]|uniref:Outer membrane beta-barrel protein n=1 Tax=Mariniflexile litorale TaxID=3045158 RepID=A0AAU7EFI5_9FLAO|nr:outer membrane beta-barrel protein [Mariniflexile sp. KMM 9835]MDQ8212271.1 outer membrane beta-barrel protein [Mariniflexile sp. KMM 9835]